MTNWRKHIPTIFVFALMALCLPVAASAQYGTYGRNNGSYGNDRGLKDAIKRVESRSNDFRKRLDHDLDRSRINGTNREDELNRAAKDFHNAASDLKRTYGDGRDFSRSQADAERLVQLGSQLDRVVGRGRADSRAQSDWSQMRSDVDYIASAYGIGGRGNDNGRGRGRGRNRDQY